MGEIERRLRALDGVRAPDLWPAASEREPEGPEPGPSGLRRAVTILVAFALVGPVAFFGWTTLRQQDPAPVPGEDPSPTPAGDAAFVAEIVCASDGTRVLTPVVALQRDGLHVQVGNEARARRDELGVELQGDSEFLMRYQPGEFVIGCFSGDGYDLREIPLSAYTPISVVDPNDYWALIEEEDTCGQGANVIPRHEPWSVTPPCSSWLRK